jgi:hypothetical protein
MAYKGETYSGYKNKNKHLENIVAKKKLGSHITFQNKGGTLKEIYAFIYCLINDTIIVPE